MTNYYAGIGSRKTPGDAIFLMVKFAMRMARKKWVLRSGHAKGADKAFKKGCDEEYGMHEIFESSDAAKWAYEEALKHIPEDRPPFHTWKPYVQGLIARNMMQILGPDGNTPVKFVVCWTPASVKDGGGTGYAMRCAESRGIPIHNLYDKSTFDVFNRILSVDPNKQK